MTESLVIGVPYRFSYGDEIISYSVRRQPKRKLNRISIHVETGGTVLVDAPVGASDDSILAAVKKRASWIHGHVSHFRARHLQALPRDYVSGESVLHLGRRYRLKVMVDCTGNAGVRLSGGLVEVRVQSKDRVLVSATLDCWVRERARVVLAQRLDEMCSALRWIRSPPPLRFQYMKVQWGSCSPQGRLTLNPYLVKAPRPCIDYVLLHELCHLKEHNHSRRFYRLLDRYMPDWQLEKARLDALADQILNR